MRVSHFWLSDPGQPGTTSRNGPPWMNGSVSPFMPKASSVCGSRALASGMPREIDGVALAVLVRIGTEMRGVRALGLSPRRQHVGERNAGPFGAADAAIRPGIALGGRLEERTPVAAAFQHHPQGLDGERLLEIGDA